MGRWTCTIIQNTETGKYRVAQMLEEGKEIIGFKENVDWKTLTDSIKQITGISFLKRKDMIFERLSDFEKIATIDATQYRGVGKDCRVTIAERKAGWQPCFD